MTTRYPIFLNLEHRHVLIVGGGPLALQKLHTLEPTGAHITVVANTLSAEWPQANEMQDVRILLKAYESSDLANQAMVFAATNDAELNHSIVSQARQAGILANAVDDPAWCDFYTPAVVRRGRVTCAISTDGEFPGISRALRETLETLLPFQDDALIDALFSMRAALRASGISPTRRTVALRKLVSDFKRDYLPQRRASETIVEALTAQHG